MAKLASTRFIQDGGDVAPDFFVCVSGKNPTKASKQVSYDMIRPFVAGITYEMDDGMADQLELTLVNQPDDGLGAGVSKNNWQAILDSKAFAEGNYVDLFLGYAGVLNFVGRTEIVRWLPDFMPDGQPFTIKAYDGRHRMINSNAFKVKPKGKGSVKARKRKTGYTGLNDAEVVKKIASKYGYGCDADVPKLKSHTVKGRSPTRAQPAYMPDWQFLQRLADINRFDLWVDYDLTKQQFVVHFKERKDYGSGTYLFTYGTKDGSLLEARPRFAVGEQVTDVEILFFDTSRQSIERTTISDNTPAENLKFQGGSPGNLVAKKEITKGARVRFSAFDQTFEVIADRPFASRNEAATFAANWLKEKERDLLLVEGKVVGIETLQPRQIHQLSGLGTRCDGLYRFTKVKHVQSPGQIYHCEFSAYKVLSQDVSRRTATTKVVTKAKAQSAG